MSEAIKYDMSEIACPSTGEPCPARIQIVDIHTTDTVGAEVAFRHVGLDDPLNPRFDGFKKQLRLREHGMQARTRGCEGPVNGSCDVRQAMSESSFRSGVILTIRSALSKLKK
ncbi:MAG: hypothetical protein M3Q36_04560 [bacterium]|nr:hypothetical protein [bacterium]